jgi:hypothetical protein
VPTSGWADAERAELFFYPWLQVYVVRAWTSHPPYAPQRAMTRENRISKLRT